MVYRSGPQVSSSSRCERIDSDKAVNTSRNSCDRPSRASAPKTSVASKEVYRCHICSAEFPPTQRDKLIEHVRLHSNGRSTVDAPERITDYSRVSASHADATYSTSTADTLYSSPSTRFPSTATNSDSYLSGESGLSTPYESGISGNPLKPGYATASASAAVPSYASAAAPVTYSSAAAPVTYASGSPAGRSVPAASRAGAAPVSASTYAYGSPVDRSESAYESGSPAGRSAPAASRAAPVSASTYAYGSPASRAVPTHASGSPVGRSAPAYASGSPVGRAVPASGSPVGRAVPAYAYAPPDGSLSPTKCDRFRCKVCGIEHTSKEEALRHLRGEHPEDREPTRRFTRSTRLRCHICGADAKTRDDFLNHMVEVHNATPQTYNNNKVFCPDVSPSRRAERTVVIRKCPECHIEVGSVEELIAHRESAHQKTEEVTFRCSECNLALPSKAEVLEHMNEKHQRVTENTALPTGFMSCPKCGHKVASRAEMEVHLRQHDKYIDIEPDDSETSSLPSPSKTADGSRSVFRCKTCNVELLSKAEVMEHMRTKHPQKGSTTSSADARGTIVRQTNAEAGISRTVVKDESGREVGVFDEQIINSLMKEEDGSNESKYLDGLSLLCFRGLLTELGQKLVDDSRTYHKKREEEHILVQKRAFAFFNLNENSTKKEAHDAYRRAARRMHPDKNKGCKEANQKFQQMKELYEAVKKNFVGETVEDEEDKVEETKEAVVETKDKAKKEAYDEDDGPDPIPKSNPTASIQYNPHDRASMQEAYDRMMRQLRHVYDKTDQVEAEMARLLAELDSDDSS